MLFHYNDYIQQGFTVTVASGKHFDKLATSSWPLVAISGKHFLTYKTEGQQTVKCAHQNK